MNKLDEILRKLLGHDDSIEIGNGYHDDCAEEIAEARQAIVEAVEGLVDKLEIDTNFSGHWQNGYEMAKSELLQAIKEWQ